MDFRFDDADLLRIMRLVCGELLLLLLMLQNEQRRSGSLVAHLLLLHGR